ncbi:hypothetical protein ACJRO7_001836 [Eucalyptus globulus]|uniref:Uncharacterized protein n=1 Tax=Eucalyptus globulus TaxID=34317 RepID=A0ABD3LW54_EUCGL
MNAAANLRWNFELLNMHQAAWSKAQNDMQLTQAERNAHRHAFEQAQQNVNQALQQVRQNAALVLSSIAEAKVFLGVWHELENNRGALNTVHVGNMNKRDRMTIRRWLEQRQFTLLNSEYVFGLPPEPMQ